MAQGAISKTRLLESLYQETTIGAFSMAAGAAAPSTQAFIGGGLKVRTVNPTTEDSLDFDLVLPRTVELDVATITFTPTVRWTAIDTPTADQTVQWKLDYSYAVPALTGATGTNFIAVSTMTTAVHTLTGHEYRKSIVSAFATPISMPARDAKASIVLMGNVRISSVSSAANSLIGILAIGCSYLSGASGTSSITP
jgi:hypothetical protein